MSKSLRRSAILNFLHGFLNDIVDSSSYLVHLFLAIEISSDDFIGLNELFELDTQFVVLSVEQIHVAGQRIDLRLEHIALLNLRGVSRSKMPDLHQQSLGLFFSHPQSVLGLSNGIAEILTTVVFVFLSFL